MLLAIAEVLAALVAAGIILVGLIGLRYRAATAATASSFGLPASTQAPAAAWLHLKGVRDIGLGVTLLVPLLLVTRTQAPAAVLGWLLLAEALVPIGDGLVILRARGSKTLAFAMHGSTALVMVLAAIVLLLS